MTTVNGLPAHILLVHAIVVLLPLTALLLVTTWSTAPVSRIPQSATTVCRPASIRVNSTGAVNAPVLSAMPVPTSPPSEVRVTACPGSQPLPVAESLSPGWMLGRSSTRSRGPGSVLVVEVGGGVSVVDGGGVVVVVGGVVGVVVTGRVGVVTGIVGFDAGVVGTVVGVTGVVVVTPVTVNLLLAVSFWLAQVAVTG